MMLNSVKPYSVKLSQQLSLVSALWLAGVFIVLLLAVTPQSGNAQAPAATVWLDTSDHFPGVGDTIIVTVRISDVVGLYAGEFGLSFPSGTLDILDTDLGKNGIQIAPGDCLVPQFTINEAVTSTGYIMYAILQLNPTPPFTGSCDMAYISFQVLQEGSIPITFDRLTLSDRYGGLVPAESQGITLTVDGTLPTSTVAVPSLTHLSPITVTWIATDTLSDVTAVELWVKAPGGSWTTTQVSSGTVGAFTYIPLAGDGVYCFATVATDLADNRESPPTGDGDVCTMYDTTAPDSMAKAPASASSAPITVTYVATDTLSGVYSVTLWYRFNSGGWVATDMTDLTGTGFVFDFPRGKGTYDFAMQATDRAGNIEELSGKPEATTIYQSYYNIFLPLICSGN